MYLKQIFSLALIMFMGAVAGQTYHVTDNGSAVTFIIKNIGTSVDGKFSGVDGVINFNPQNIGNASVQVKVAANTVFTDNSARDKHLKKEDYFHVDKFTSLSFVSTKIVATNKPGNYTIEGNITIKGVSKLIAFPFQAVANGSDYVFSGTFKLNRRDFNVGGNSWVLSDNLIVNISLLAKKK
jgi:polyisoprenoid-binding protein YceI